MGNGQEGGAEMVQCVKVGKLNLVDLAGSERVHITGATGETSAMQRIFVAMLGQRCHPWDQATLAQQGSRHEVQYTLVMLMAICKGLAR